MARRKYEKKITPAGIAVYPHLTRADYEYNKDGDFHTGLALDPADPGVAEFIADVNRANEEAFEELKAEKPAATAKKMKLYEPFKPQEDEEGNETGKLICKFKMRAHVEAKNGDSWDQKPALWDSAGNEVNAQSTRIWGGSTLRIKCELVPFFVASSKEAGVTLRLKEVQIIELVEGQKGGGFGAVEGGYVASPSDEDEGEDAPAGEDSEDAEDY